MGYQSDLTDIAKFAVVSNHFQSILFEDSYKTVWRRTQCSTPQLKGQGLHPCREGVEISRQWCDQPLSLTINILFIYLAFNVTRNRYIRLEWAEAIIKILCIGK